MASIAENLQTLFLEAVKNTVGPVEKYHPSIAPSGQPQFGHYQFNDAMKLAKGLSRGSPYTLASQIIQQLPRNNIIEKAEVAGPGFINISISPQFLLDRLKTIDLNQSQDKTAPLEAQTILLDYSSPNIAKEMHVGHLRSTIIGDCLANIFEYSGHRVHRISHLGDWGTQFGMLIAYLKSKFPVSEISEKSLAGNDLISLYQSARRLFDEQPNFQETARQEVVALQSGDFQSQKIWKILCDLSQSSFQEIYLKLNIQIKTQGESFYNPLIPKTIEELSQKGMVTESEGALCIFLPGFKTPEGNPLPLIIQKKDSGYNYASTDLAALRYRFQTIKANKVLYITDAGQTLHFQQIFASARQAGWIKEGHEVIHIPFGLVLGEDGKKLKTRSGETIKLMTLIGEAEKRALAIAEQKEPENDPTRNRYIAHILGLAALKYADLSQHRMSDYVFSFDKMLSLDGNTAPYLIYAYVRIQGIARKGNLDFSRPLDTHSLHWIHPLEKNLALQLVQFDEALSAVLRDFLPNRLCEYLYQLSQLFNRFYQQCRVLGSENEATRILLCHWTARTLAKGLSLLGIKVVEKL